MSKVRLVSLLVSFCVFFPYHSTLEAQDQDVLNRDNDESARTVEEKQRALSVLQAATRESREKGELLRSARFMNRVGSLQLLLNSPQDSLATYREALTLLNQAPDAITEINTLNGIGTAYNRLTRCDEAQNFLEQAIALSDRNNHRAGKAEALLVLSLCQNSNDHARALETAGQALLIWQSLNNKLGIARSYAAIGHYQLAQDNLTDATQSHEIALGLWRELKVPEEEGEALINLGFIEYRKGAWQSVLSYLSQAQSRIDEKAEPFKMGQITAGLAEAFIESGLPETGLTKAQEALEFYRQAQSRPGVNAMMWDMGKAYYLMGNYSDALSTLEHARADAETIKQPVLEALAHDFLGRTYLAMNGHETALQHFQIALDLYTKVKNPMEAARTQALMGQVYQQQGNTKKANKYYLKALEVFRTLSDRINESAALYVLGKLELQRNNLDLAEAYLLRSISVTEDIRRISSSSDLTTAFSATVHERYESYIDCLMRKHQVRADQALVVRAFEMSELARGRSLAELLRSTQTNLVPGLIPELAKQEKALRQSLKVKEDSRVVLLARKYTKAELQALDDEVSRLEAEYGQVTETIRAQYPSYQQVTRPIAWDLRQIQERVIADDQTVLLEYSLGPDKSYVWLLTRNDIKSYELPAESRINEAAQRVLKLLTSDNATSQDELARATRELRNIVLSPIETELNKKRMIVVADGALHYIPFQVLPSSSTSDEPLVATVEVINAPSASIIGQLRQETVRRQTPTKVLAAFGDPVFASNYAQRKEPSSGSEYVAAVEPIEDERWRRALRDVEPNATTVDTSTIQPSFYTKRELANLRDLAGPESLMVTSFEATRERLAGADLTNYAILHFATHGVLDPKWPENSGLFLSMVNRDGQRVNGFVGLHDIYALNTPVDLVVLSACRTGLGKEVRGEGLISLTRGFMYAGASSVVATLWEVDDEATAELMKQFYTNMLQRGMTPAAALRSAQNTIRQEPQWRSPYYWAAFALQGEYQKVIKTTGRSREPSYLKPIAGAALITFLAGAAWLYIRRRRM